MTDARGSPAAPPRQALADEVREPHRRGREADRAEHDEQRRAPEHAGEHDVEAAMSPPMASRMIVSER